MKQYYQCRLQRYYGATVHEQTAWIPRRGAKVGATVELLPSREMWMVTKVYEHGMPEDVLKKTQQLNRRSLPSVEPIK